MGVLQPVVLSTWGGGPEPEMLALLDVAGQAEAAAVVINPEQFLERSCSVNVMAGSAFHLVRTGSE